MVLWPMWLWAQPPVGTACSQSGQNVLTLVISSCTASGTNRFVATAVTITPQTNTVTAIAYGADTQTLVHADDHSVHDIELQMYGLVNPAAGAQTVQVDYDGFTSTVVGVLPLSDVHQTTSLGTAASAEDSTTSTSTVNVSSSATERVIDATVFFFTGDVGFTPGAGQTEHLDFTTPDIGQAFAMSSEIGSSTTTMSWTFSAADGSLIIAVPVKPATVTTRRGAMVDFP